VIVPPAGDAGSKIMSLFGDVPRNTAHVILGASPLAVGLGFYSVAIAVFLPLEGISVTNLGALLTTFGLTTVAFSIPFAILSDRYGRKHIMLAGSILANPPIIIPGLTTNFLVLEASAIAGGMGEAMYLSTWNAYLADTTTEKSRPAAFSLSFMTFTVASGIGSFVPGLFYLLPFDLLTAHRLTFAALGLLGFLTPLSVSKWAAHVKPRSQRKGILPRKSFAVIAKFSITNLMIGLGAGLIIPLIPTWFYLRYNVTDVFTGPLLALANIIMGLAAVVSPRIGARTGLVRGVVITQLSSTIFLLAIPFSPNAYIAAPIYVIRAMLMNMSSPLSDTFLMNMIAEDERATASSFNVVVWRLPNAASTVIGGSLLNGGDLNLPFYLCTALYVASISLFFAIFHRAEQTTGKELKS
jgi:MFS family permease